MDKQALDAVIAAYNVAPSVDLAQVIFVEMIRSHDIDRAQDFQKNLDLPLSDQHAEEIVEAALQAKRCDLADAILDRKNPQQTLLASRCSLAMGNTDSARLEYLDIIQAHPELESDGLNDEFGVSPPERSADKKPKLRVIEKSDVLNLIDFEAPKEDPVNFSSVAGLSSVKKQIERKIILPFKKPSMYRRFKKKVGGGVMLYGPPGCGKTLIARATAGEADAQFINVQISDVLDMYIGESERKLEAVFAHARSQTPSVIFFDELEALAGKREYGRNSSAVNVVSQFLSELDGFSQNNTGVLVLASTNTPWAVDSAFLRPGRFDRLFFVPPPDREARLAILEMELEGKPVLNIDLPKIAAKTSGFSGADLANLVDESTDVAIEASIDEGKDVPINQKHFDSALSQITATTAEWLTTARNYARYANDGGRYDDVLDFLEKNSRR